MRINLVKVQDLADQHLFAEWREIKMAPQMLRKSLRSRLIKDIIQDIPRMYTLNKGHGYFFFDKMRFLAERYQLLTTELIARDYNISDHNVDEIFFDDIPDEFKQRDWSPKNHEISVNVARIVLRLNERPDWYKHYGNTCAPEYFEALYQLQLNELQAA